MAEDVLTLDEAAAHLKLSKSTLYKLLQSGRIPAKKLGRRWRFSREDLEKWLRNPDGKTPSSRPPGPPETTPAASRPAVISDLLKEERTFEPPPAFTAQANVSDPDIYEKARAEGPRFWERFAAELHWFKKWDRPLQWDPPYAKWFVGGTTNISYNCLDLNLDKGLRNKAAIIWEGEKGEKRTLTYWDLHRQVCKFANVLRGLGVEKGDRVALYMPMIPELAIAMLACVRIGAVHSVVFAGFSAESLADRINDAQAKLLITADGGFRRGGLIPLKHDADYALRQSPGVEHVIIVRHGNFPIRLIAKRDLWWDELMQSASADCAAEPLDSEHMSYILYTSGTTGKPKGIVHTTGGYMVGCYATSKMIFDLKQDDVFWCTADIGWVTGHSYIVYGPLCNGATIVMYEGAPDWPDRDRFWAIVEEYGVTVFYTAPTAIRTFMKWGPEPVERHDLSSLRLLGTVGEPINPEAWMWYFENIGNGRCPVVDTYWQTETGHIMITNLPGIGTMKPGSAGRAVPGIAAAILDEAGNEIPVGAGYLAVTEPWPGMIRGIYGDHERFVKTYWSKWPGIYFTGDGAKRDEMGYFTVVGRVDDVLNVAGHRIGTMEVESALVDHPSVAEAAVVGTPHEIKGEAITAFVTIKESSRMGVDLVQQLKDHVVKKIGAIARPENILFTADLPKTRSGKIMRRLLRDIAAGKVLGDMTALAEPAVIEKLKKQYRDSGS
ncbi:MAG: acetate--CoA ligase [Kiritimatiellaeota bacterium]|nr:acetate--CoA ligase [Kiritimatiellota bacterium]